MDVGTTLRAARERRELSLSTLAARTKIPPGLLLALEDNAFDNVPRGIFVRGYLRAYAREVGLDPEAIVQQFREETGDVPAAATAELHTVNDEIVEETRIDPDASGTGPGWGYGLIVAALLVAFVSFTRNTPPPDSSALSGPERGEELMPPTLQQASTLVEEVTPVGTAGDGVRFELQVQGPCWVEAIVDGRRRLYRLMQTGDRESIDVGRELVLRIGDPGAFMYSINGRLGEPLGRPGVPITVRFKSEDGIAKLAS